MSTLPVADDVCIVLTEVALRRVLTLLLGTCVFIIRGESSSTTGEEQRNSWASFPWDLCYGYCRSSELYGSERQVYRPLDSTASLS